MKKIVLYFIAFFICSCASTSKVTETKTNSNTINSSDQKPITTNVSSNNSANTTTSSNLNSNTSNFITFSKHPQATPLLNSKDLYNKKLYTKLSEALKEPHNVYRFQTGAMETEFEWKEVSSRIGELYNLQELEISGPYSSLPKEIGKLTQLQYVKFSINELDQELPNEIANWKNVKRIDIEIFSKKQINTKPVIKWNNLYLVENLEDLFLSGKEISEIPQNLNKCKKLKSLTIHSSEKITSLPIEVAKISSLDYLNLFNLPNFSYLPELTDLKLITKIDIENLPKLQNLPKNIGNPATLHELNLRNCSILQNFSSEINKYDLLEIKVERCPLITTKPSTFDLTDKKTNYFIWKKNNINQQEQNG